MRSFRKILLLLVIFCSMEAVLTFILEPVTYADYLEKDLKKLAAEGQKPDVVLIGDSRIYRSFVPDIFDEGLGGGGHCTINAGTGSQTLQGSYFYLKDLLERYPVKYAFVGLTYTEFLKNGEQSIQGKLVIWDRLQSMTVRLDYLKAVFSPAELPYLLTSYRYRSNFKQIPENVGVKLSAAYRKGLDERPGERYENRGYVWSESGFRDGEIGMPSPAPQQWTETQVEPEAFLWMERIAQLCAEEKVRLIFVTGPTTLSVVYSVEEYEKSYQMLAEQAERIGVPYFELNLLRDRRHLLPDSMMRDSDHVCGTGAEQISRIFCDIMNRYLAGEDVSDRFYSSVEEMQQDIHAVVACDFHTEAQAESGERTWIAQSLQANGDIAEYQFLISDAEKEGDWVLLQDYGTDAQCNIPAHWLEQHIWLRVNARLVGSSAAWESYMVRQREPGD